MKEIIWIGLIAILAILFFKAAEYDHHTKMLDVEALKKAADDAAERLRQSILAQTRKLILDMTHPDPVNTNFSNP